MSTENPNEPPLILLRLLAIAIVGILLFVALWFSKVPKTGGKGMCLDECFLEIHNEPIIHIEFLGETYLISISPPFLITGEVYGILIDEDLYKILECENFTFDPELCNQKYGCESGIGLGQLTAIAIKDCENNLNKEINPRLPEENLECSIWLYETYGTKPWGDETTWWGSYNCWKDKIK